MDKMLRAPSCSFQPKKQHLLFRGWGKFALLNFIKNSDAHLFIISQTSYQWVLINTQKFARIQLFNKTELKALWL